MPKPLKILSARGRQTRLRMLDAAADLFHAKGVKGTSPDDVIAHSGTGKSQFYHYFGSKEGLVVALLEHYLEQIRSGTAPLDYEIATLEDLERWFGDQIALQRAFHMERGCPFGTIGADLSSDEEPVRTALGALFGEIRGRLLAFFNAQQDAGRLKPHADPEALADYCLVTIQGGMLLGRIERDSRPAENAVAQALIHIRGHFFWLPRRETSPST